MFRPMAVLVALLAWTGVAEAKSPPPAATSEFLVTQNASFAILDIVGVWYAVTCSLRSALGVPVYATFRFENPSDRKAPLTVERTIEPGQHELAADSPAFRRIQNETLYKVEVRLFQDKARTKLLGQHVQKVYFAIPPKLAAVLGIDLR